MTHAARLFVPSDGSAVSRIDRASFGEGADGVVYWTKDRCAPPNLCVVATEGDAVLAYCDGFLAGGGGDVRRIAARADRRGEGHAARALRGFLAQAAARGAAVIHLEVAEDNAPALRLYARAGFEVVGRRADYYGRGRDAAVLAVSLDAPRPGA